MKHYLAKNNKHVYILVTHACQHANTWRQNGQTMTNQTSVLINQPTNTNNLVTIDTIVQVSCSSCSSERPLFKITSLSGETAMMLRTSWQGHPFQVHRQHVQLIVYGSTWVNFPANQHKCAKSKHFKTFCMGSGHPSHHGNPFEECSMQISMNWLMMIDDHTIPYPNMGNLSSFIQALAMPHITTGTRKTYEPMVWELFSPNGHSERMASENHTSSSSAWHVTAPTCTTAQLPLCNIPMDSGCKMMQNPPTPLWRWRRAYWGATATLNAQWHLLI